jgi:hypothetical protein
VIVDTAPDEFSYLEAIVDASLSFLESEMTALGA